MFLQIKKILKQLNLNIHFPEILYIFFIFFILHALYNFPSSQFKQNVIDIIIIIL